VASGGEGVAAREVAQLAAALQRLRADKDARGALALLDEHRRRFPVGALGDEARVVRVEALLALGRSREALEELEELPGPLLERSRRLRVARGELRAAQGRCQQAREDFAAVAQGEGVGEEISLRAERGRAACAGSALQ
jgi:hypothetical protein